MAFNPAFGDYISSIGNLAAQPAAGTVVLESSDVQYPFFHLTFTLNGARITTTDAGASGSFGSLKLFTHQKGSVRFIGSRQNYTAFAEGAALTTGAGNCVHVLGLGSTAIVAAADGTLGATENDIGIKTAQITNSGGTGTGSKHTAATLVVDGTSTAGTAAAINLNWSGTAATSNANSTIDVTGTITVVGVFLGNQ